MGKEQGDMAIQKWEYKVVLLKDLQIFEVNSDVEGQGSRVEFHN
jgi:hypothetical protein